MNDISNWVKAAAGGVTGLALNWAYARLESQIDVWVPEGSPLRAVEHGDVGMLCWLAAQHIDKIHINDIKKDAVPYLAGLGTSLVLLEFTQPPGDAWALGKPYRDLSVALHLFLAGLVLAGLAADSKA